MATPRNRNDTRFTPLNTNASCIYMRLQEGWLGDFKSVYSYRGHKSIGSGHQRQVIPPTSDYYYGIPAGIGSGLSSHQFIDAGGVPAWSQKSYNRAYAKFRENAVGENSQLGVTFAEWRQSLGLIEDAALGMVNLIKSLNARGLARAFRAMRGVTGKSVRRKLKTLPRELADIWLKFWFGWSATASDLYGAGQVFTQPVPGGTVKPGTASCDLIQSRYSSPFQITFTRTVRFKVGGEVYIANPNVFLANQLGLLNPATFFWELIPFSFVVDWLTDFSSFLGSFTDFLGLSLVKAYTTCVQQATDTSKILDVFYDQSTTPKVVSADMIRKSGIQRPLPTTDFCGNLGSSHTRALSALSLLTQQLSKLL